MGAESGDVRHVSVPDRGQRYTTGDRVDFVEGDDGAPDLQPSPNGLYLVVSCTPLERNGVKLLSVGVYRRD